LPFCVVNHHHSIAPCNLLFAASTMVVVPTAVNGVDVCCGKVVFRMLLYYRVLQQHIDASYVTAFVCTSTLLFRGFEERPPQARAQPPAPAPPHPAPSPQSTGCAFHTHLNHSIVQTCNVYRMSDDARAKAKAYNRKKKGVRPGAGTGRRVIENVSRLHAASSLCCLPSFFLCHAEYFSLALPRHIQSSCTHCPLVWLGMGTHAHAPRALDTAEQNTNTIGWPGSSCRHCIAKDVRAFPLPHSPNQANSALGRRTARLLFGSVDTWVWVWVWV
jgi:hypothetical protein